MDEEDEGCRQPVLLHNLAGKLGYYDAYSLNRVAIRLGFKPYKLKGAKNASWLLSAKDADALVTRLEEEKAHRILPEDQTKVQGIGGVYCVEAPSYTGIIRVKIGWADNFANRFNSYRTLVPDLRVRALWVTRATWMEQMAITYASNTARRVSNELFECDDIDALVAGLTAHFSALGISVATSALDDEEEDDGTEVF